MEIGKNERRSNLTNENSKLDNKMNPRSPYVIFTTINGESIDGHRVLSGG